VIAFHPVTWMLKAQIAQTREMVCDEMATDALVDRQRYTLSLLRLAAMIAVSSRVTTTHAIGIFDANILEKRIMTMRNRKQQVGSVVKYGVMSLAALFLLSAGLSGAALAVVVEPGASTQTANATKVDGQVYRIGNGVSTPVLTHQVDADFPKSYLKSKDKLDGQVVVALVVDATGVPRNVHVTHSFNPDFNANAIHSVEQYRFSPAKRLGKPVAVSMNVEVHFQRY
jgi:TonB family protein